MKMKQFSRPALKAIISGYYDLQKMRIQAGNRIVANFKLRIGQGTGQPERELDKEGQALLVKIRKAYTSMAAAAKDSPTIGKFVGNEVISDFAEFVLADVYDSLLQKEKEYIRSINQIVHAQPFWPHWLKGVNGVGELMGLVILGIIDIRLARHPSSIWKYCGLDVADDGRGRSSRREHLVLREYKNKNGEDDIRESLSYNKFLKTKLLGVLGPAFLKAKNEKYSKIYYDEKHRLENHPVYKDGGTAPTKSKNNKRLPSAKKHRHDMANRKMVKIFLIDLHVAWREFEKLPVSRPYHEAKLGLFHGNDSAGGEKQSAA